MAPSHGPPVLGLFDLHAASLSSVLPLEAPASVVRFAMEAGLLCLAGADGVEEAPSWEAPQLATLASWGWHGSLWVPLHMWVRRPCR